MEELTGGREQAIFRRGDKILRPMNPWSPTIHTLLTHLHDNDFTECPEYLGIEGTNELLSFIEGDSYNYPLVGAIASETALISAAQLLRKLHDCTESFSLHHDSSTLEWMLPTQTPADVICHGDFTPYNVALKGNKVVGVFDFDTAHPAPRIWDIAFSVYCWAPIKHNVDGPLGVLATQIQRAKIFCDSYNVSPIDQKGLVQAIIKRLTALVNYMRAQADAGNSQFQQNLADGHHLDYLADIDYLLKNEQEILTGLQPPD